MENIHLTNKAIVVGTVSSVQFSHKVRDEAFYTAFIETKRLSNVTDLIPIIISEKLYDIDSLEEKFVQVSGEFRSFDYHENNKTYLKLFVFVKNITALDKTLIDTKTQNTNYVMLNGHVCKDVIYRQTPLGKDVADVIIAVNRPYGNSDYIPCICWKEGAKIASTLKVGDEITITGRIQSRYYTKQVNQNEIEKRIVFEISVYEINTSHKNNKEKGDSLC